MREGPLGKIHPKSPFAHRVRSYTRAGDSLLGQAGARCDGFPMATPPGHRALRKGRSSLPGQIYLLTTTTAGRVPWFIDTGLARATCQLMTQRKTWGDAHLLCWVLMPDHWHGLLDLGERDDLSLVMNRFKSITSKRIRQIAPGRAVWARGFHDHALRHDESVHQAARYIIANPIRAGLVQQVNDYPYWNCTWL